MALKVVGLFFVGGLANNNLGPGEREGFGAPTAGFEYWNRPWNGVPNTSFVEGALRYFGISGNARSPACKYTSEAFGFIHHLPRTGVDHIDPLKRKYLGIEQYTRYLWGQNFGVSGPGEGVAVITHSMGCAYSMGMMEKMHGQGVPIAIAIHINPFQPASAACTPTRDFHVHVQTENDPVVRAVGGACPPALQRPEVCANYLIISALESGVKQPGWIAGAKPILRPGPSNPLEAHFHPISQGEAFWFPGGARASFGHPQYDRAAPG